MKFWKEFKAFICRGNILDLAVGVIIGGAFSAIVTALTNKIIMPLINLLLSGGGENGLESARTMLKAVYDSNGDIDWASSIFIDWGEFITAIINFLLIALVLFLIIKAMMNASKVWKNTTGVISDKDKMQEKKAVKKLAKEQGISFKQAWAEHEKEKMLANEEAQKQKEIEEEKAKEEAYRNSTEGLLKEICALLKEQNKQNKVEEEKEAKEDKEADNE